MTTTAVEPTVEDWKRMMTPGIKLAYKLTLYDNVADQFTAKEGFHLCQIIRAGNAVEIRVIINSEEL